MKVSEAIRTKRAVRQFQEKALLEDEVRAILNAGRRSQSSHNTQPWQFIAVRDQKTLGALSTCGTWAGHLAKVALGVAILIPNPSETYQRMFDAGQAAAYLQLAAWELGIGSCLASIHEFEKARLALGFPSEWVVEVCLSFGYPLEAGKIEAAPKSGGRKTFDEVMHWEKW
jgi:nitroreductase